MVFRRLAVFVGGCRLDDAEAVVAAAGPPATGILEALTALVEHSLVRQQAAADGEPRLAMLETIREFALEQLVAGGEADTARRRTPTATWRWRSGSGPAPWRRAASRCWGAWRRSTPTSARRWPGWTKRERPSAA